METQRRNRTARSGALGLFGVVLLAVLAVSGLIFYASSEPPLDWSSGPPVSLQDKMMGMIADRSLTPSITEGELEALLKKELYENRMLNDYTEITGAAFSLNGDMLIARTDLQIAGRFRIQLTHTLQLEWQQPDIVATHLSTTLKDIPIPTGLVPIGVVRVPLAMDDRLPVIVDNVLFEEDVIRFQLRIRGVGF